MPFDSLAGPDADLLRCYHRAAALFDPSGYAWPRPVPARFRTGLVSHNDVYPANVVFRDGRPGSPLVRAQPAGAGRRRGRHRWLGGHRRQLRDAAVG